MHHDFLLSELATLLLCYFTLVCVLFYRILPLLADEHRVTGSNGYKKNAKATIYKNNTMAKRNRKGNGLKTLHRKQKIEQREPQQNPEVIQTNDGKTTNQ